MKGISAIVASYNGQRTIEITILSLLKQNINSDFNAEVIVISNNSSDETLQIAQNLANNNSSKIDLVILNEKQQGKSYAQKTGIENAKYPYLIIVDDDNELDSNYFETVFQFFEKNEKAGIINGNSYLPKTEAYKNLPFWWETFKWTFAVGEFGANQKEVEFVFGAGMAIRKKIFDAIYQSKSINFHLTCRKGADYSSGGDIEHCYIAKLFGYKIYFHPELSLIHHIAPFRFTNKDLQKLYFGIGPSTKVLNAYKAILKGKKHNYKTELRNEKIILFLRKRMLQVQNLFRNQKKKFIYQTKFIAEQEALLSLQRMGENEYNEICEKIDLLKSIQI